MHPTGLDHPKHTRRHPRFNFGLFLVSGLLAVLVATQMSEPWMQVRWQPTPVTEHSHPERPQP